MAEFLIKPMGLLLAGTLHLATINLLAACSGSGKTPPFDPYGAHDSRLLIVMHVLPYAEPKIPF
jgi:hypothetical protein